MPEKGDLNSSSTLQPRKRQYLHLKLLCSQSDLVRINPSRTGQGFNVRAKTFVKHLTLLRAFGSPIKPIWSNRRRLTSQPSLKQLKIKSIYKIIDRKES